MTKYVFVTGGVLSGLGKGLVTCSVGKMLEVRGFNVTAVKCDPYLNVDAGTMNPYIHGEVFVLDDGYEADMDLGTYERFLNGEFTELNNITSGQVYQEVIRRERKGGYLGRCVQIIPHVTDEIKRRIRLVAGKSEADIVLIECGGTVGDIEGLPFLEAFRQMRNEERKGDTLLVHVTLVPVLDAVGEPKTKPTQHSVKELRAIGLNPDIIAARVETGRLGPEHRRKIALYCSVEERAVFSSIDVPTLYELPLELEDQGMGEVVREYLGLDGYKPDWSGWKAMVDTYRTPTDVVKIAMCGKYAELADCYVSVNEALRHAASKSGCMVQIDWIETEVFEDDLRHVESLDEYDGVLVPGGFGQRGAEGKIIAINHCRTQDKPFLGICYGFQLATVEYARHVVGLEGAASTECVPETPHPVIDLLPEQKEISELGGTMRLGANPVILEEGSLPHRLYGSTEIMERHRHRWEVNPEYWEVLEKGGAVYPGWSKEKKLKEVLWLPGNYFFLGTQFHPEFKSRPWEPSPPYYGLVKAAYDKKLGKPEPEF
ncbi:MAG: CTP synthase [Anaerolineae bacterium]|nr:CTP synthase [Anaerolineae bacterium]NIN98422.1 CTP synthase [Anaerolineae bacterium]NIQ81329.1 CTP synthase [Anaerolineae bacterium]